MTLDSSPDVLVLHAVRVIGFAEAPVLARRYGLDASLTNEALLDAEARGWVGHTSFAGSGGWSLTESGRAEGERRLAAELARVGGADRIRDVYRDFLPLNTLLQQACTDWQLRPAEGNRLAVNDHSDPGWDAGVLDELAIIGRALAPLVARLAGVLARFRGYDTRFRAALVRARAGEGAWVDGSQVDSCHRVWFELHEDLVATLGIDRHTEP
ncbi:transcriptional regulator [Nonomuraea longicatena]|uniref:Transcriptional regulator n=1 Tax=Nonomuraea longicatena TaxID=83682 RepID=A0ABP3ZP29_9ACTN